MNPQEKAHDLMERYVREVGQNLPAKMRDDVAAELRTLLEDAVNERALAAGRPPDEDLAVEVLREFGEPEMVAGRYLPADRFLIGPRLFPAYLLVVKIVLFVLGGIMLLSFAAGMISSLDRLPDFLRAQSVGNLLGQFLKMAFVNLGLLTLVFAVIEWFQRQERGDGEASAEKATSWNPRDLPAIKDPDRLSPAGRVWHIYVVVLLAIVFNFFPEYFGIVYFTNEKMYTVSVRDLGLAIPVSLMNAWWLLALMLNMVLLRAGRWTAALRWWEFGLGVFGAVIVYLTLIGAEAPLVDTAWLVERGWDTSERAMRAAERVIPLLGKIVRGILSVVLLITVIESLMRLWRLATRYRAALKQSVTLG